MVNQILLAVLRDAWLIDPVEAREYYGLIRNQLTGVIQVERATEEEVTAFFPSLFQLDANGQMSTIAVDKWGDYIQAANQSQQDLVAVLPISGAMTKSDQACGPRGTSWMASQIQAMQNVPKIKGIVLRMDTPGGQVSGTRNLADAIANSKKPIIAYADDGNIASAGYWVASKASRIISSHATNRIGSIGVYMQLADMAGMWEQKGVKLHTVYSSLSSEKNSEFLDALKGQYEPLQKNYLDRLASEFISEVKAGRGDKLNLSAGDPFKGAMFFSDQALEIGLIDEIGSLATAIQTVGDMAKGSPTTHIISKQNHEEAMKINATHLALLALLGIEATEGAESHEWLPTGEELDTLNARVHQLLDAETQAADLQTQLDTTNGQLASLTRERDNWKTQAEEYGKLAGKFPGATGKGQDPNPGGKTDPDPYFSEADADLAQLRKEMGFEEETND